MMMLMFVNLLETLPFNGFHSNTTKTLLSLCRDDGLAVFKNINGPQAEKIKKT